MSMYKWLTALSSIVKCTGVNGPSVAPLIAMTKFKTTYEANKGRLAQQPIVASNAPRAGNMAGTAAPNRCKRPTEEQINAER